MGRRELHIMQCALLEDGQTMRYTCPLCRRCLDDGPAGLTLVHRGDQSALHRAGALAPGVQSLESVPPPTLH